MVLLAAVLRLGAAMPGMAAPETTFFRPDTHSYLQPALALLEEGRYVGAPGETEPYTLRGPGYPAFLALVFGVLGKGLHLPVLLFCILGALTCVPVYRVGCWFGGTPGGTVAALLLALNLTSIAHAPFYLSDTLFALVTAWMLYFLARFYFRRRLPDLWLAVFLDAAGTLIRPTGLLWIVPCLFLVLVFQALPVRQRLMGGAGCLLIFAAVLTPWMYRNSLAGGGFRLDTNVGNTLYYHNCAALVSVVTGIPRVTLRDRWVREAEAEFAAHPRRYPDEDARTGYKLARARELIGAHKWTYLRLHFNPSILLPDAPSFLELLGLTQPGRAPSTSCIAKGFSPPCATTSATAAGCCCPCCRPSPSSGRPTSDAWSTSAAGCAAASGSSAASFSPSWPTTWSCRGPWSCPGTTFPPSP